MLWVLANRRLNLEVAPRIYIGSSDGEKPFLKHWFCMVDIYIYIYIQSLIYIERIWNFAEDDSYCKISIVLIKNIFLILKNMRYFAYHVCTGHQTNWLFFISNFFHLWGYCLKEGQSHNPEPHIIWQAWHNKQELLVSQTKHSDTQRLKNSSYIEENFLFLFHTNISSSFFFLPSSLR